MGGDAREERPSRLVAEPRPGQPLGRAERRQAEPRHRQRVTRDVEHRPQELRAELVGVADERPEQPSPGPAVRAAEASAVTATERSSTAARPPSSGCATGASGWTNSTPWAARSIGRKNGEASVSGRIVEQMSWRNPGRVSSSVRVPPPAFGAAS